ncbi:hypothetical protein QUB75_14115 [Microcoleus sp. K1-B6]|uniref:hypothetical protein n=1 Tax=unclassified Microcoleus TaxID=2642155 RepID=UPI002FD50426
MYCANPQTLILSHCRRGLRGFSGSGTDKCDRPLAEIVACTITQLQLITRRNCRLVYLHLPTYLFGHLFDRESSHTFLLRIKYRMKYPETLFLKVSSSWNLQKRKRKTGFLRQGKSILIYKNYQIKYQCGTLKSAAS